MWSWRGDGKPATAAHGRLATVGASSLGRRSIDCARGAGAPSNNPFLWHFLSPGDVWLRAFVTLDF